MNPKHAALFTPLTLNNGVTLNNRLVVAPMTHYASQPNGAMSEEERHYLSHRLTGFGLFISAATLVAADGKAFVGQPTAIADEDLPSLQAVANLAKSQGTKAILQLHHGGNKAQQKLLGNLQKKAPSDDAATGSSAMSEADIVNTIAAFGNATRLAIQAGFDGVEIHGANGYLLQQFFSAQTNQRDDAWGGSIAHRLRFVLAVIEAVSAAKQQYADDSFIIGYRFSPEEAGEKGLTMTDTYALLDAILDNDRFVKQPLQYLHISLWDFYKTARRGADPAIPRIALVHAKIAGRLPLIGVGNLLTADAMTAALNTGWAEMIAVGKAVLMNPNLVPLITSGQTNDIVTALDITRQDRYGLPNNLWQQCTMGLSYLPPIQGKAWQPVDI